MANSQTSPSRPPASFSRLFAFILLLHVNTSLHEEAGSPSHTAHIPNQVDPPVSEFDRPLPSDPVALCNYLYELAPHLRSWLPAGCEWLGEEAIKFVSDHPIDVGEVANIFVAMRGNRKVVVKCYRFYPSSDYLPSYTRFRGEALACGRYRNHGFVPFIGIYSTPQYPMCLVFEYMDHSNLKEYLRKNKHVRRCKPLLQVARALEYLHDRDVVHRNVKITNVLVDARGRAHLGGLGLALLLSDTSVVDVDKFFHGAAPELVDDESLRLTDTGATKVSDAYALGVLAWEVFAGKVPFSDKPKIAGVISMWKGHRPARPNHAEASNRVWKMIQGCWKLDPGRRMTIAEVVAVLEEKVATH